MATNTATTAAYRPGHALPKHTPGLPATVCTVRIQLEHAPAPAAPGPVDLAGWWVGEGFFVCATCAGRIFARGCRPPAPVLPVWGGEPIGPCCAHEPVRDANGDPFEYRSPAGRHLRLPLAK